MNIKEQIALGKVLCRVIIEVMGSPEQYVIETLQALVKQVQDDKRYEMTYHKFFDATPQDKMHSAFVETDILFKDIEDVRAGKYFEIKLSKGTKKAAEKNVKKMCEKLLANTVIEDYNFKIEA